MQMAKEPAQPAAKASKSSKDKPTKAGKQTLAATIRARFGLTVAQVNALIDENDGTLDAEKIEKTIRDWLRERPKK